MKRGKSSARWLREHFADEYVKRAREAGYRSRAVYKLQEIQDKDHLIRPGMTVLDLGAAPGGWSQLAVKLVGKEGRVIALDILPMEPLAGVETIKGDFREQEVFESLLSVLGDRPADLVISDMAPNSTGIKAVDQLRQMYLTELALDLARQCLKPGGGLLLKVFQGEGFDALLKELRKDFSAATVRKPKPSRARSREVYLLSSN